MFKSQHAFQIANKLSGAIRTKIACPSLDSFSARSGGTPFPPHKFQKMPLYGKTERQYRTSVQNKIFRIGQQRTISYQNAIFKMGQQHKTSFQNTIFQVGQQHKMSLQSAIFHVGQQHKMSLWNIVQNTIFNSSRMTSCYIRTGRFATNGYPEKISFKRQKSV